MKKAIKKTCVVLLLFALLASQVAASYSETGTLNEGTSAISAAERYLSNWAYNSYMYADKNLTLGTVLDAEVDPAKLTLATSEFMALRNDADGQENNISVAVSKMQANIQFMILKAADPVSKLRVFGHLGKGLLLIVILPAFPAQQPLIAGKSFRLIVQHRLIDRHRRTHLVRQEFCHLPAVCLVDKAVFLLDQTNFVPLRLGVLAA